MVKFACYLATLLLVLPGTTRSQQELEETALSVSESLSVKMNYVFYREAIHNFYNHFAEWTKRLDDDSIPEEVIESVNEGNFCIRKIIEYNQRPALAIITIGPTRYPEADRMLREITLDTNIQYIFNPFGSERPRDTDFIICLVDKMGDPLFSNKFVREAYSELVVKPIRVRPFTVPNFSYELNESSWGMDYSLIRLIVLNTGNGILRECFDKTIVESNQNAGENINYHYLYDFDNGKLIMLRIDDVAKTETIENYIFDGKAYIPSK
jgi:hypothetical protein